MTHELEADSIIISLGQRQVLSDVYLKCETGDVVGILGRNGSGKSTLLKVIFGTTHTYNKNIRINKKVYSGPAGKGNLIAYLPQHSFLPKNISIKKIAAIFIDDPQARKAILAEKRIHQHVDKTVMELSCGERRYLEILLLVNLPVKFVLLDEPFSGLEPLYKERIISLIHEYRKSKGFIITDHDYRNIIEASSRIVLLVDGSCKNIKELPELEDWNYVPPGTFGQKTVPAEE
jgi:ABC-type multidrug transport system ATPase subunit